MKWVITNLYPYYGNRTNVALILAGEMDSKEKAQPKGKHLKLVLFYVAAIMMLAVSPSKQFRNASVMTYLTFPRNRHENTIQNIKWQLMTFIASSEYTGQPSPGFAVICMSACYL